MRVIVNASFEAKDEKAAQKMVESWDLPDGASVSVQAMPLMKSGTIEDGKLVEPPPPELPAE